MSTLNSVYNGTDKVIVMPQELDGVGDYSGTHKTARALEKMGIPKENILIATNNDVDLVKGDFTYIKKTEISKVHNLALQIVSPATHTQCFIDLIGRGPVLIIQEYGLQEELYGLSKEINQIMVSRFGLEWGDLGIFIEEDLHEWSKSDEAQSEMDRLAQLKKLSFHIQKEILGEAEDLQNFSNESSLYFGYARHTSSREAFIKAIAAREKDKNLLFILPGSAKDLIEGDLTRHLKSLGFKDLKIKSYQEGVFEKNAEAALNPSGKKITILTGHFLQEEIKIFLKASKKPVLTTGDHSVSEAISIVDKQIIYEVRDHKQDLGNSLRKRNIQCFAPLEESSRSFPRFDSKKILNSLTEEKFIESKKGSEEIISGWNAFYPLQDLVIDALNMKHTVPNFVNLANQKVNLTEALKPDIIYYLNLDQIISLKIEGATSKSQLEVFKRKTFEYESLGKSFLLRMRKEES